MQKFLFSAITVLIQYYNYHLFGFLAANIARDFLHQGDKAEQLLSTYLIMSVAMLGKPLGSVILGNIGDKMGRTTSFKISLIGTGVASLIIASIPTYDYIGILASVLLILSRFLICSFVSAGSDGVRLYIYENISDNRRCLGVAATTLFTQVGSFIATISAWFFTLDFFPNYAWRLAFLTAGFLSLLNYAYLQKYKLCDADSIIQSNDFEHFQSLSLKKIIGQNKILFTLCVLLAGAIGSTNQFVIIFFGTYNFDILNLVEKSTMYQYTSAALLCYMIFGVIGGYFADRFGYFIILIIGIIIALFASVKMIIDINFNYFNPLIYLTIAASFSWVIIPSAVIYKQAIPKAIRYRIFSLSHSIGSIIISAPTAYICTYIYIQTNIKWLPIIYLINAIIMILLTTCFLQKRVNK